MTGILLFLGMAFASDPIERPATPAPIDGECYKVIPINKGKAISPVVMGLDGIAKCSAVAVPLSQFSDLLQTEQWSVAIQSQYKIETSRLDMEIDWYKSQLEKANQPVPWMERPSTQRWLGRMETILIVGVVSVGLASAYSYGAGVMK